MNVRALVLSGVACLVLAGCVPNRAERFGPAELTVVSYNIRHGRGMDGEVNLARTGRALARLAPDIVALQEVDRLVERSGQVDESRVLGEQLGMQHAFGAFMPYQGGEYGMAILSRFPIVHTHPLRLPDGNEPRIALMAELSLPDGARVLVVNVHFDWVANDSLRYRQVDALAAVLDTVSLPTILLGDFNDQPGSRTLSRWQGRFRTIAKPATDRFTFSSTKPEQEIDHILVAPAAAWGDATLRVVTDTLTSDHRPLVARITRIPSAR